jgi:hypothetical protein
MGLPRDPAKRTAQDWAYIELGGMIIKLLLGAFGLGGLTGFAIAWLVVR